jgi:hypothetical protein
VQISDPTNWHWFGALGVVGTTGHRFRRVVHFGCGSEGFGGGDVVLGGRT